MFERLVALELKQEEVEKEEVDNRPNLQDEWDLLILKSTFLKFKNVCLVI